MAKTRTRSVFDSLCALLSAAALAGCAANPNSGVLIDPLKQRLSAREDSVLRQSLATALGEHLGRTRVCLLGNRNRRQDDGRCPATLS